jgi:hypothetical protein
MPSTTNRGYPYPSGAVGIAPDVPGDIFKLAKALDDESVDGTAALVFPGTVHNWDVVNPTTLIRQGTLAISVGSGGANPSGTNLMLTIPTGYRPRSVAHTVCWGNTSSTYSIVMMEAAQDGGVRVRSGTLAAGAGIFGQIAWAIA